MIFPLDKYWFLCFVTAISCERIPSRLRAKSQVRWFGDEAKLLSHLMRGYQKSTRPVANASHVIVVKINFAITQILDMDEKNQVLTTNVWFPQEWHDEKMVWDPSKYNGLAKIRIPPHLLWRPDIVLYNGVDDYGDRVYSQCQAMVGYNGTVFWAPIANLRSTCKLDLTFFPFDDQTCLFKVGSWTYDGFQVDLTNKSAKVDLGQFTVNGGWDLVHTQITRNVIYYPCCLEPFPDVTFTIVLRRRTLYYVMNVVTPCLLLSGLSLLGFWLPVGTSEKVSLGTTVLLAFYVLGLSISERVPETSESVPLIGVYLVAIMGLTSISVAMCVFILHLHRLGASGERVPRYLQTFVTRYLAKIVGMRSLIRRHRRRMEEENEARQSFEATPLRIECEDFSSRYKLIQVEGSGLFILAKDSEHVGHLEKEDKEDINDLHKVREKGTVLKPLKAVLVNAGQHKDNHNPSENSVVSSEIIWHDIAEVLDRCFFWLCFVTVTLCTVALLVIMPMFKPDLPPEE